MSPGAGGGHLAGPCYVTCPVVMRTAQLLPMLDGRAVPGKQPGQPFPLSGARSPSWAGSPESPAPTAPPQMETRAERGWDLKAASWQRQGWDSGVWVSMSC